MPWLIASADAIEPVQRVAGQRDDVERVHDRDGVGDFFGRGGLEPRETVHGHHLDSFAKRWCLASSQLLNTALDRPGPCRAVVTGRCRV